MKNKPWLSYCKKISDRTLPVSYTHLAAMSIEQMGAVLLAFEGLSILRDVYKRQGMNEGSGYR